MEYFPLHTIDILAFFFHLRPDLKSEYAAAFFSSWCCWSFPFLLTRFTHSRHLLALSHGTPASTSRPRSVGREHFTFGTFQPWPGGGSLFCARGLLHPERAQRQRPPGMLRRFRKDSDQRMKRTLVVFGGLLLRGIVLGHVGSRKEGKNRFAEYSGLVFLWMCLFGFEAGDFLRISGRTYRVQGCCIFWGARKDLLLSRMQLVSVAQTSLLRSTGKDWQD